jgi:hypothetical protein
MMRLWRCRSEQCRTVYSADSFAFTDKVRIDTEARVRAFGQRAKLFTSELAVGLLARVTAATAPLRHELDRFSRSHEPESMQERM